MITWLLIPALLGTPLVRQVTPSVAVKPVPTIIVSSPFGVRQDPFNGRTAFHKGVDLKASRGTPIRAIGTGTVVYAGPYWGYGQLAVLRHGRRLTSHYAHCEQVLVRVGDRIKAGAIIARVGDSGRATGPHLHFELRLEGRPMDPSRLLHRIAMGAAKNEP